jgi:hypothetical protein
MIRRTLNPRQFTACAATFAAEALSARRSGAASESLRLAAFHADVTVPLGHPLMGGGIAAGKYNDGSPPNRELLASRVHEAMRKAWAATQRLSLTNVQFRSEPLELTPRNSPGFTVEEMKRVLTTQSGAPFAAFAKCKAALGLSWRERVEAGRPLDVPVLDFGPAQLILLPAESYVEFQLFAQAVRPEGFVMAVGYGECAPGYIPIEKAWAEDDSNLRDWCWVAPGAETAMKTAIAAALKPRILQWKRTTSA